MILTDEEREALAHRIAWRYKKSRTPHHSDTYTFNRATLLQFSEAIERAVAAAVAKRCIALVLAEDVATTDFAPGVQECIADAIRKAFLEVSK